MVSLCLSAPARAEEGEATATFALVVGVNRSVDEELKPLRYADDDAARFFDLFRSLGARTYLLTRPDENTGRLHPQAAAEAKLPNMPAWEEVLVRLSDDMEQARAREVKTVFYFVYAGHGNEKGGRGYITLEDGRLTGGRIAKDIVERVGAGEVHLIVDACHSYLLVDTRGPGGRRRPLHDFSKIENLIRHDHVGLLLSTSSAAESHEWEAFQAGVFSHEVRSGLYGAADVDRDGRVSYREIAAFVERANAAVINERFRPQVFARPPRHSQVLLDIRQGLERRLELEGAEHGHHFIENTQGIRLVDFHNPSGQPVRLMRPAVYGPVYLRNATEQNEYLVPADTSVIRVSELQAQSPRADPRGAAQHAFEQLFSRPFGPGEVERFEFPSLDDLLQVSVDQPREMPAWRRYAGLGALSTGALAALWGVTVTRSAVTIRNQSHPGESQQEVAGRNRLIDDRNITAATLYAIAGCSLAAGLLLLLWPDGAPEPGLLVSEDEAFFTIGGEF
jgi:hypothetical protein